MNFEWDDAKRRRNSAKHGIDFITAVDVFKTVHVIAPSTQQHSERRFIATARIEGRFVSMRGEVCRVISARSARNEEKRRYHSLYGGGA